ncbi:2-C-methyl-D-erythritol 4-phosphate cytidylyltransferase [Chitinimonas viridis]|uniref:2-C-methyl-D-erythritol 4-phosphate cytidylyltransferase n=1 Tax=Chitinimonas viridis TaxID=664880 RepID=A0ABT8B2M3_9NEIS|nr:2-C-methyl-D-erythritol 4-phosphate cytidylyltransferase [Chitinimonas viridis]MDN3576503.1 2-C-methyl-D-erythritol 4-phosphate cytidylyltransferase [Chitinimonas viridis]
MSRYVALLPAAGAGSRMASSVPKQYLALLGEPLLLHTLRAMLAVAELDKVVLVLSADDSWFEPDWVVDMPRLTVLRCGGASRAETVRNGLQALAGELAADDWVLVHDAARPCIDPADVARLITTLGDDSVGGLLAVPVADTLKRADAACRVAATVPRDGLWRAQTPQMFRHGALCRALAEGACEAITDEASAIEAAGMSPSLVMGDERNIKVTYPQDLALAALYLQARTTR